MYGYLHICIGESCSMYNIINVHIKNANFFRKFQFYDDKVNSELKFRLIMARLFLFYAPL